MERSNETCKNTGVIVLVEIDNMYFKIMIESLEKKIAVLDKILVENNKQKELFGKDDFDEEALKETFDKKSELID